jgi:hypothetical protein
MEGGEESGKPSQHSAFNTRDGLSRARTLEIKGGPLLGPWTVFETGVLHGPAEKTEFSQSDDQRTLVLLLLDVQRTPLVVQ